MSIEQQPGFGVKIGRSYDSHRLAEDMAPELPVDMIVHAVYRRAGPLMEQVHERLLGRRSPKHKCWFQVTPAEAMATVAAVMSEE